MSYVVTARKWRPQFFHDVISQKHVTETLKKAIKSERVGHAYLFSGTRGVGKTTVARILAKALNCVEGPAEEPCNKCENCVNIQAGTSLDIQELDGASNNSVDDARKLISNVGYHASHCRYKIYIIDEVHMLSKEAFNALLKTIEEPPSNVIFILATTEPHKIPVTILSRCQRFDFHRLSAHDIAGKLRTIVDADGIAVDEGSLMLIAQRAVGAMRDAESILEQLKSSRGETITVSDVNEVLGLADREVFFSIVEHCHDGDVYGAIELFKTYYDEGGDLREFVEGLLAHLRDVLYARYDKGLDHVMLDDSMKARVREQSQWFDHGDLIRMITAVTDVESSLAYAILPVLRIELALARLATMDRTIGLNDLFKRLGGEQVRSAADTGVQSKESAAVGAARMSPPPPPVDRAPEDTAREEDDVQAPAQLTIRPDISSISAVWKDIVAHVSGLKPHIGPSLSLAVPDTFENDRLTLAFGQEHSFHVKAVESNADLLAELLGPMLGRNIKIVCIVDGRGGANGQGGGEKKKNELDDLIAREPIIKDILDKFDGEINGIWRE